MLRREHLDALIFDCNINSMALLESIVAQMSEDEYWQALEYISRVEDWEDYIKNSVKNRSNPIDELNHGS
jgi:hypothetical protein